GEKGDPGEKGADGTMIFEDLTDDQIAGLKGDKGEKGDPGEDGGFNGETIGIINIIDISKFTKSRSTTPITQYEIEKGIVHYNSVIWNISQNQYLNGVKHSFRVEDYLVNPTAYDGLLRFEIRDMEGTIIKGFNVEKR